jgi:hypothetical protein
MFVTWHNLSVSEQQYVIVKKKNFASSNFNHQTSSEKTLWIIFCSFSGRGSGFHMKHVQFFEADAWLQDLNHLHLRWEYITIYFSHMKAPNVSKKGFQTVITQ